jgi:WD40 repeat protein
MTGLDAPSISTRKHELSCGVVAAIVNFSEEPRRLCTPRAASSRPTKTSKLDLHSSQLLIAIVESLLLLPHTTMAAPEVNHLFHHPIADHSFSADRETLAVARENNVDLYARQGSGFKLQDELTGHDKTVTGVDIAPNSGKIVTCSQGEFGAIK